MKVLEEIRFTEAIPLRELNDFILKDMNHTIEERKKIVEDYIKTWKEFKEIKEKLFEFAVAIHGHKVGKEIPDYIPEMNSCSILDKCSTTPEDIEISEEIIKENGIAKEEDFFDNRDKLNKAIQDKLDVTNWYKQ